VTRHIRTERLGQALLMNKQYSHKSCAMWEA
jgi:hypothetical protein